MDKSAENRQQKFEELFLRTQDEQENFFELSNRGQNVKNENATSRNAIWSAIDNFIYIPQDEITFTSYFRRYDDLVGFYDIVGYLKPNPLYTYVLRFSLVGFYDISTTVAYLKPNAFYRYILNVSFLTQSNCFFLHTVKWFQVFLSNTNNYVNYESFVGTKLNEFDYCYLI